MEVALCRLLFTTLNCHHRASVIDADFNIYVVIVLPTSNSPDLTGNWHFLTGKLTNVEDSEGIKKAGLKSNSDIIEKLDF